MLAIDRFFKLLTAFLKIVCLSLIFGLALLTFVKVIFRYVFNIPIVWSDEIIMLMLLTLTYFGAALAANDRSHISVDLLELFFSRMGSNVLKLYHLVLDIIFMSVLILAIYYGIKICFFSADQVSEILMISYFWIYSILPSALIIMVLMILKRIWEDFFREPLQEKLEEG